MSIRAAMAACALLVVVVVRSEYGRADDVLPGQDLGDLNRCGPLALQVCAVAAGRPTLSREIAEILPRNGMESSLSELEVCARRLGMHTLAVKWRTIPPTVEAPAIIPITVKRGSVKHFVALIGRRGDRVLLVDPPFDSAWVPIDELTRTLSWEGYALHVSPSATPINLLRFYVYGRELMVIGAIGVCGFAVLRMLRHRTRRRMACVASVS